MHLLYPKNQTAQLSQELFQNPTSEYRGAPFWAWNCKLDEQQLLEQIGYFKEMGLGGFHIHSRTGMGTPYLSDEFMGMVQACRDRAEQENMLCWLYDEDRWPSGAAGGLVTRDHRYRARHLRFTPYSHEGVYEADRATYEQSVLKGQKPRGYFIAKYAVRLDKGYLKEYHRLTSTEDLQSGFKLWWAFLEVAENSAWFNNQAYVNTLDPEAIRKFIATTHERYFSVVGEHFGRTIPAIFTDEPQFSHKGNFKFAEDQSDVIMPYTDDLDATYYDTYQESLLDRLPELYWQLPGDQYSVTRYRYHDHLSERFTRAFADQIGTWCEEHGIMLTGHMMDEPTLRSQTGSLGEAMRSYRSFQLPGIDMLCDWREYTTAKQAQSAAHQYGRPGVTSELYGVTNWDFDFRRHKLAGDWQAALGVTVRVHHLSWVSMAGEAKRDYPASINYQSPWFKEYPIIENHFSRVHTALTRGRPAIRVGVIHPIESYWLHWGPEEQTSIARKELEDNFENITKWLLFGLVDFNFISESLLPELGSVASSQTLQVGQMAYEVIIVPGCLTLRTSTLDRLEAFRKSGGKIVFAGAAAQLVDGQPSDRALDLANISEQVSYTQNGILAALEDSRDIDILHTDGSRTDHLIYQLREDGECKWLFIAPGFERKIGNVVDEIYNRDMPSREKLLIRIRDVGIPTIYDTITGEIHACNAQVKNGLTELAVDLSPHDSLLLMLEPGTPVLEDAAAEIGRLLTATIVDLKGPVPITLSEPNVLLLDMASYSFDSGEWKKEEEILRIDNLFRGHLGYASRTDAVAQPWIERESTESDHTLSLKYTIHSEFEVIGAQLAMENLEQSEIVINGSYIPMEVTGWFVDRAIHTISLPPLAKGNNEIIIHIAFGTKVNVEWCYLLGDFGVRLSGRHATITPPVRELAFGDWTSMGLPFYAGNVTYHCEIDSHGGALTVETPKYSNPLLSVEVNGRETKKIFKMPYEAAFTPTESGNICIDITAFGNRYNAFGPVHNCDPGFLWHGPNSWRTRNHQWAYEYQLKPMGLLVSPRFLCK